MSWVAVGAAAVGVVGNSLLNSSSNGQGTGASSAAQASDPFGAQRYQYQPQLAALMGQAPPGQDAGLAQMQQLSQQGVTPAGQQLTAMTAPGATFNSSDPSFAFRQQQGQQAVERSGAAAGLGLSGNALTAISNYGQQSASQEYQAQFQRLSSLNSQELGAQAQQFGEVNTAYTSGQNQYNNQYQRLAQLAGANTGQPGQAGQQMVASNAGTSAFLQQLAPAVSSGVSSIFGSGSSAQNVTPQPVVDSGTDASGNDSVLF